MRAALLIFLYFLSTSTLAAKTFGDTKPSRPVATYSIVAIDERTGDIGVAVQSHWFSVGSIVIWAEAGVGAVATQSFVEPSYGPKGLQAMRKGRSAEKALVRLLNKDDNASIRQVAFVDAKANAAAHTGENSIPHACDAQGYGFSVQANLMQKPTVCNAMAAAFEFSKGDLATRMMDALDAAQAEGGDLRGKQSAAMLIVDGERHDNPWEGKIIDLRVEDNPEPLKELRRLVELNRAYNLMNSGDAFMAAGNLAAANNAYDQASALAPNNHEMIFWRAVTLAAAGEEDAAMPLFEQAFAAWPMWRELIPRLPASVILPDDPALIARIMAAGIETENVQDEE